MSKKILIDAIYPGDARVVIYENDRVQDFDFENSHKKQLKGNIYLARVTRVEPSLQAAFIEYGGDKHGFLPFNEINPNYFLNEEVKESELQGKSGAVLENKIPFISLPENTEAEDVTSEVLEVKSDLEETSEELVNEVVEDDDFDIDHESSKYNNVHQKYKIQDVIKKGQVILIQVNKEERGNKGAACTTYISLAGRYCVLMPNSDRQGGISRRIVNSNDRRRLKEMLATFDLPEGVSIILRTAGAGKHSNDIRRDYYYLARLWNAIREHTLKATVNSFIHAESDLLKRTIRDLYSNEISEILVQGSEAFKTIKEFIKKLLPLHANKVKEYRNKVPIFTKYNIEEQLAALYNPVATLPSGGYIVINPTEALIAIDVNSGKATTERNIEETATKTNIEAAVEIARQLRLRDMSGLIVIDFIDMLEPHNRRSVENALHNAFQSDRAKVQISNISPFGLLELSRQRLQSSFMEANTVICPSCNGKGHVKSMDSNALVMLRTIESEICKSDCEIVNVYAHPDVVLYLLNNKRDLLLRIEQLHKCKIVLHKENTVYYDGFSLEKIAKADKSNKNASPRLKDDEHIEAYGQDVIEDDIVDQEEKLGLGSDLAPLKVNDDMIIAESASAYPRNNHNRRGKFVRGKRRINRTPNSDSDSSNYLNQNTALIYQPENANKRRDNNRRKPNKFHHRNKDVDGNKRTEKKSALKSWWEKLIE